MDRIAAIVEAIPGARRAGDLFSGTSRVGHALKSRGLHVTANDHLHYAHALARCYVQADARRVLPHAERLLAEMAGAPPEDGYFTRTFAERSRYFQPKNARRIDGMRRWLREAALDDDARAVLLVALMEAADRVDSTTGLQMAYLKEWSPRSANDLELRIPRVLPGEGAAWRLDAREAAARLDADVAYLDPPYNQHSYMGNYHVWETLARGDEPDTYGVACKRVDCQSYGNPFNSRKRIRGALEEVLEALRAPYALVSFNNEGFVKREEMEAMLARRGHLRVACIDYRRYVGAQIGIHNPRGEKVGKVSHLRNQELLYLVGPDERVVEEAIARAAPAPPPPVPG